MTASGAILAGQAVYISNTNAVSPADADALATARVIGVAESAITNGLSGYVTISGQVTVDTGRIDGGSFVVGQPVYLSQTVGNLTSTKPTGVNVIVYEIGIAVASDKTVVAPKMGISLS